MDTQAAFDAVVEHLYTQGRQCIAPTRDGNGVLKEACVYRGPDNTRCAIGALIPDGMYKPQFEGRRIPYLMSVYPQVREYFAGVSRLVLDILQWVHDSGTVDEWPCLLYFTAIHFELDTHRVTAHWDIPSRSYLGVADFRLKNRIWETKSMYEFPDKKVVTGFISISDDLAKTLVDAVTASKAFANMMKEIKKECPHEEAVASAGGKTVPNTEDYSGVRRQNVQAGTGGGWHKSQGQGTGTQGRRIDEGADSPRELLVTA